MKHIAIATFTLVLAGAVSACSGGASTPDAPVEGQVSSVTQAATQANVWHGSWNGGSADATLWGPTSYASVNAWENKSGKSRAAYLNVYAYEYDPDSLTCQTENWCWDPGDPSTCWSWEYCYYAEYTYTYGWGEIPMKDFGVGKKTAHLETDLSKDPSFYGYSCNTSGCNAATGTIDLTWQGNGYYSYSQNGTSTYSYSFGGATYSSRTSGQSSSASANVDGTLFGTALSGAWGSISQSVSSSVSKDILKN